MQQAKDIDVRLRPSFVLALLLVLAHAAAMIAVAMLPLSLWLRVIACLVLLGSAAYAVPVHAFRTGARACTALHLSADGNCALQFNDAARLSGTLLPGWFVTPALLVLRVRCRGERWARGIVLLSDSADADELRRLRIFLRFAITPSVGRQ